ncbi:hypothetical protein CHH77_12340 [Shouchella clausii]|nr:hypothetical protein CHH73_12780 [Shouchella clausii]PAE81844.1 hypothetical protein CHH77_12340 [Shouchella clausii]
MFFSLADGCFSRTYKWVIAKNRFVFLQGGFFAGYFYATVSYPLFKKHVQSKGVGAYFMFKAVLGLKICH